MTTTTERGAAPAPAVLVDGGAPAGVREARFTAMGTHAHVVAVGAAPEVLGIARRRIAELEARWTRFDPRSELVRLDAAAGRPAMVSPDTYLLIERMLDGWLASGGAFDPTLRDAIEALGYSQDFGSIDAPGGVRSRPTDETRGGSGALHLDAVELDPVVSAVRLPAGVRLDAGGIGKGLAADLVTGEMLAAGAQGAMVSLGGDLRVRGRAPHPAGWVVAVDSPHEPGRSIATVTLADGGVCTSSTRRRRWRHGNRTVHHLLDPASGAPWGRSIAAVTVVAGEAWWAEVATKVAMRDRTGAAGGPLEHTEVLVVHDDRSVRCSDPALFEPVSPPQEGPRPLA